MSFGNCTKLTIICLVEGFNTYDISQTIYPSSFFTFSGNNFDYSGTIPNINYTFNGVGFGFQPISLSFDELGKDADTYTRNLYCTFSNNDMNFDVKIPFNYVINKVLLLAKVLDVSREYGEVNPAFIIEYSGFVNGENENVLTIKPTISTSASKNSNVGEYPITISGGSAKNYILTYESGVLTINKAPLTVKVNDATRIYGVNNPSFSLSYVGLKNNETVPVWTTSPTFSTSATKTSNVGTYAVAANCVAKNYNVSITPGTLTITPAALTISANNTSKSYYSDNPAFSCTYNGFVNGDTENVLTRKPKLSTSATLSSSVGTYEIVASGASSQNYSIKYVNGLLTVTPRTLIASVGNYERSYNEENPVFEVKYEGFVGNENDGVLITKPVAKTSATKTSDVGTYTILVLGGSANNYKFSYSSGSLTINKAEQSVFWEQDLSGLEVGDQVELMAVSSSGLPITYSMDQNDIAEVYRANNKYYMDCKAEGETQIVAVQDGNQNYYSSSRVRKKVVINNTLAIDSKTDSSPQVQNMPFGIRVKGINIDEIIKVYSTDGVLHKLISAKEPTIDITLKKGNIYIVKIGMKTFKLGI